MRENFGMKIFWENGTKTILTKLQDEFKPTTTLKNEHEHIGSSKDRVIIENGRPRFLTSAEVKKSCLWVAETSRAASKAPEAAREAAEFTHRLFAKWKLAPVLPTTFEDMLKIGTTIGLHILMSKERASLPK